MRRGALTRVVCHEGSDIRPESQSRRDVDRIERAQPRVTGCARQRRELGIELDEGQQRKDPGRVGIGIRA